METNIFFDIKHLIKECIENNLKKDIIHITKYEQKEQRKQIKEFQEGICSSLKQSLPFIEWITEKKIDKKYRDSIDIYGTYNDIHIIIELDKPRADQIAKKMLSRFSYFMDKQFIYIALCYPGTKKMNPNECKKYFEYAIKIAQQLSSRNRVIGYMINESSEINVYE